MSFLFFDDTATTEIYTLSLHDALPISGKRPCTWPGCTRRTASASPGTGTWSTTRTRGVASFSRWPKTSGSPPRTWRSEEHTSELQSHHDLVCRLLLEKNKQSHRSDKDS